MPDRYSNIEALHLEDDSAAVDTALISWLAAREERRRKPKARRAAEGAVYNREDDEGWTAPFPKR